MEERNDNPLVTVAIVTYNQSRFIIETLESVKAQTYLNIELVVSDDCSTDDTAEKCRAWIEKNKGRFAAAKLVTTPKNTGIAGNANRALAVTTGEWVKLLGGDDLLCSDALENYVKFVGNGDVKVCFAEAIHFSGNLSEKKFTYEKIDLEKVAFGKRVTVKDQYNILKRQFIGSGPTFFASKAVLDEVGGFDERFPLMDDHPLLLRIAKAGHRFYIMPEFSVYKRVHAASVSQQKDDGAILPRSVVRCNREYKYRYKYEELNGLWKLFLRYSMSLNNMIIVLGNSRNSRTCMICYRFLQLTDPFKWYSRYLALKDKMLKE